VNDLLARLLDLQTLRWGAPDVALGFERPIPAWAWGGIVGAALIVSLWSYWKMEGAAWARTLLALARASLLVLLALLVSGPQLVQRSESEERDWVLVLVDRSASMTIADAPSADGPDGARTTREGQMRAALERSWPMWRELSAQRTVVWMGFDSGAFDLAGQQATLAPATSDAVAAAGASKLPDLAEPRGRRTQIGPALDQALARAAARPLSAVVIISDGKTTAEPTRAAIRRLQGERVPVHTVALGSAEPVGDVAIRRVDVPRRAFATDQTPVRVELERLGGDAAAARGSARVKLIDKATGLVLDQRSVELGDDSGPIVLVASREQEGSRAWQVVVEPDGPDLVAGNNAYEFTIDLVERPLRVLYIDGYPRWEQRYVKNLLLREKSINASTLILAPDRRYIQESDTEIDALPQSIEEWAEYDAVILGDVSPDVFTTEQLAQLREHVARRGGGLLWIGGEASVPGAWWDTPLADLLPFVRSGDKPPAIGEPIVIRPTESARRLGLMQLGETAQDPWPPELADLSVDWAQLRWAQRIETSSLKPAVEVLATSEPIDAPIVISMRFGAGRSLYVATDEIWRWRYGRGEVLPERFWLQMIRLLGREGLSRSGQQAVLEVTPRRADVDQPVRVSVELLDQLVAQSAPPSISVRLTRRAQAGDPEGEPLTSVELVLRPERDGGTTYAGIWLPPEPGTWTAEPTEPLLSSMGLSAEALITLPDDEMRHPETDHPLLASLSQETAGVSLAASELSTLPEHLPNRRRRLLNEVTEPLWDTPLALLLVVTIATFEWVGRRVIRLI
jgi:hypothetical protein